MYELSLLIYELVDISSLNNPARSLLSLGQETLFPLKENVLPVLLELAIPEDLGARLVYEVSVPQVLAAHAVGVARHGEQVRLDTCATRVEITKRTLHLFVIGLIYLFATYRTVVHFSYLPI